MKAGSSQCLGGYGKEMFTEPTVGLSTQASRPEKSVPLIRVIFPREHGAWAMAFYPYFSAVAITGQWSAKMLLGAVVLLLALIIREPLTILARQRWQWRTQRAEARVARAVLLVLAPVLVLCSLPLLAELTLFWAILFTVLGLVTTLLAVWATVHNRQRSVPYQLFGMTALSTTAFLGFLLSTASIPPVAFALWGLQVLHLAGSILTVHVHLLRTHVNTGQARLIAALAWVVSLGTLGIGIFCWSWQELWLGTALVLSAMVHLHDLVLLRWRDRLYDRLQRLGLRELGLSTVYSLLVVIGLRNFA